MRLIRPPSREPATADDEARTCARIIGEEATCLYPGQPWSAVEPRMAEEWRLAGASSGQPWSRVRGAAHAAWQLACLAQAGQQRDDGPVYDIAA